MSEYALIKIKDGTEIWVEVGSASSGVVYHGTKEKEKRSLPEQLKDLKASAEDIRDTLKLLSPKNIEVEFGVVIAIEAGTPIFALAKGSIETNYKVTLKWSFDDETASSTPKSAATAPSQP